MATKTNDRVNDEAAPESVGAQTAAELLQRAAALLDEQTGPRANKFYRGLAADVRRLAARIKQE
ncbi:MAG: hypothetical protein KJ046_17655 [Anaerolineae bacterium]|nr:hypothetical protein [Anaerolineae bacterium]